MNNYDEALKAQAIEADNSGLAMKRYSIYLDNAEAAQNRLTSAIEGMWQNAINSDKIKDVYNFGTEFIGLVEALGGLETILPVVISLIIAYNSNMLIMKGLNAVSTVGSLGGAFKTLLAGIDPISIAIVALTATFVVWNNTVKKSIDEGAKQFADVWVDAFKRVREEAEKQGGEATSADLLKQFRGGIAGAKEIKGTLQDPYGIAYNTAVKTGLAQLAVELESTSKNYDEYIHTMQSAARAEGYWIDENGNLTKQILTTGGVITKHIAKIDLMTKSERELSDAQAMKDRWADEWEAPLSEMQKAVNLFLELKDASEKLTDTFTSNDQMFAQIAADYEENGEITLEQANKIIEAGYAKALVYDQENNKISINVQMLHEMVVAEAEATAAKAYSAWQSAITAKATESETIALMNQFYALQAIANSIKNTPTAISSIKSITIEEGGSTESSEKKHIEAQIKSLQKKKDALKDNLDEFKKWIDAQKESLRLEKEEREFSEELLKKNKSLAKLKTEIAVLALDTSEAARAKRLGLEEEAANLETEITEDTEDRKYELQIDALDKAQDEFEDKIDRQIDKLDDTIDKYKDQASSIEKSTGSTKRQTNAISNLGTISQQVANIMQSAAIQQLKLSQQQITLISEQTTRWLQQGLAIDTITQKTLAYAKAISSFSDADYNYVDSWRTTWAQSHHNGGLVESHHDGDFAGSLKSNEVFSKLLKGEYVSTEGQMDNFMTNILPKIASYSSQSIGGGSGDMSISMPISVAGNLDKTVLPDLKNMISTTLVDILKVRGKIRTVSSFST